MVQCSARFHCRVCQGTLDVVSILEVGFIYVYCLVASNICYFFIYIGNNNPF